jgi:membrane protein implicated in regulation of membrane protease activity
MSIEPYQISVLIGIILAIIELFSFSFIFIGFASAMMVTALIEYILGNFSWNRDLLTFSITSILFIYIYRKYLMKNKPDESRVDEDVNKY